MPVATTLKRNFSVKDKKMAIISTVVATVALITAGLGFFIFQQQSTRASEEAPVGVSSNISPDGKVDVVFQTPTATTPVVKYGTSIDAITEVAVGGFDTASHQISLTRLQPNTTYYFVIEIGTSTYDNNGEPWTFTTRKITVQNTVVPTITPLNTVTVTISPTKTATPSPTLATASATIRAVLTISATPRATISSTLTPKATLTPRIFSCTATTNCSEIISQLGSSCTTQDYLRCINASRAGTTPVPTESPTPLPTAIPQTVKNSCSVDYVQSNNACTSWTWADVFQKNATCKNTFNKYFVQCKSTSFNSSTTGTWYCNETKTSNSLSLPCGTAPTPPAGGQIYCRVRAESDIGGNDNATEWVYGQSTCPVISGDDPNCNIDYIQANTCTSWIWDFDYQKDPRCKDKFSRYFFQCTNDGNFNSSSRWYCNSTSENHYLSLPCYNATLPPDGSTVYCRVRAEDSYGELTHASSWKVSAPAVCPTSTPTPTLTPTNTPTATHTPTNIPTNTPTNIPTNTPTNIPTNTTAP